MVHDDEQGPDTDPSGGGPREAAPPDAYAGVGPFGQELGVDLSAHLAGHALLAKLEKDLTEAGVDSVGGLTPAIVQRESSWALGYLGEQQVGLELGMLGPGWRVIHSVPVGQDDADIDHLVIGPPGVFTVNSKHHVGRTVDVRGDDVFVVRHSKTYIPKAQKEAVRAAAALQVVLPPGCPVVPVVAVVGATRLRHRDPTPRVWVVQDRGLVPAMTGLPPVLTLDQVEQVYQRARWSGVWRTRRPPAAAPSWVVACAEVIAHVELAPRMGVQAPPPGRLTPKPPARPRWAAPTAARPSSGTGKARKRPFRRLGVTSRDVFGLVTAIVLLIAAPRVATDMLADLGVDTAKPAPATSVDPYAAGDELPVAIVGQTCPKKGDQARTFMGGSLLLCTRTSADGRVWTYADPWLRLPAALAGQGCEKAGAHARSVLDSRVGLVCSAGGGRGLTWSPDPGWEPTAR